MTRKIGGIVMNDTQDKQYVALELTKILFNDKVKYKPEDIYKTYTYFLIQLCELMDTIETATTLKDEIERLQKENERLKINNQDIIRPFANDIMNVLNGAKGDMEPYVYSSLVNIIKAKIQ